MGALSRIDATRSYCGLSLAVDLRPRSSMTSREFLACGDQDRGRATVRRPVPLFAARERDHSIHASLGRRLRRYLVRRPGTRLATRPPPTAADSDALPPVASAERDCIYSRLVGTYSLGEDSCQPRALKCA